MCVTRKEGHELEVNRNEKMSHDSSYIVPDRHNYSTTLLSHLIFALTATSSILATEKEVIGSAVYKLRQKHPSRECSQLHTHTQTASGSQEARVYSQH